MSVYIITRIPVSLACDVVVLSVFSMLIITSVLVFRTGALVGVFALLCRDRDSVVVLVIAPLKLNWALALFTFALRRTVEPVDK